MHVRVINVYRVICMTRLIASSSSYFTNDGLRMYRNVHDCGRWNYYDLWFSKYIQFYVYTNSYCNEV